MALLAFMAVALGIWALAYALHADQPRVLARQAAHFGLQHSGRTLTGRGIEATLVTEGAGRSQNDVLTYTVVLEGCPAHLALQTEGARTGAKMAAGERELETGDVDFDDLLWVESGNSEEALTYLTDARRTAFTEAFWALPEARVEGGRFVGRQPWRGESTLREVLTRCLQLCTDLEAPRVKRLPRGWVNDYQRRYHASFALVFAVALALPGFVHYQSASDAAGLGILTGGLLFVVCATSLLSGAPGAAARLRGVVRLLQVAGVGAAAIMARDLPVSYNVALAVVVGVSCYGLERWRHALLRVR